MDPSPGGKERLWVMTPGCFLGVRLHEGAGVSKLPTALPAKQNGCGGSDATGFSSVQFSCSVVSDMNRSMPGLPVHHQPPEFT